MERRDFVEGAGGRRVTAQGRRGGREEGKVERLRILIIAFRSNPRSPLCTRLPPRIPHTPLALPHLQ